MKYLLLFLAVICGMWLLLGTPIAQDNSYHNFQDNNTLLAIPNFWNVVSNLPFLMIGIMALIKIQWKSNDRLKTLKITLATGILLTGLGSGFYHWHPKNFTLIWDRIPMTIVFTSFFFMLLYNRYKKKLILKWFWPSIIIAAGTVFYWYLGELHGKGDLRPYAIVQFAPIVITLFMLFDLQFLKQHKSILFAFLFYIIAKLLEHYDEQVAEFIFIGGHPLKHLFAALSCWFLVKEKE